MPGFLVGLWQRVRLAAVMGDDFLPPDGPVEYLDAGARTVPIECP
jgi:hypothetical protein